MKKTPSPATGGPSVALKTEEGATGTYVYDKALGRVVKVSRRVPGLSKSETGASEAEGGCGKPQCGMGACGMGDGGFN